jgi:hypothetical protein
MALPAQVRKQSEAVNKLYEELNADTEQTVETTESEPEGVEGTSQGGEADSAANGAPKSTKPTEQAAVDPDEEETFEKRYRSLQGMYNAEVPRLAAEKRELTNRVQQLEQLIASMNAAPAPQQEPAQKLVTEQDLEDYGDSIDVMRRVFREEMASKDAEIGELKNLVRQMQGTVVPQVHQLSQNYAVSNEQRFWADLQTAVPDWQEINGNKEFQAWLLEVDPLTGIARQTYLDDAQRNMDARRVANFFTAWKGLTGKTDARTSREPQSASELERQVAPGKGRSGGAKPQGEAKTYTSEDIKKFFSDVQKGKYKGRETERDRIERDIFAAQREGRIVTA